MRKAAGDSTRLRVSPVGSPSLNRGSGWIVANGEILTQAPSLLYKDRKLLSSGGGRTWRVAGDAGDFTNCVAALLVGTLHSIWCCSVNHGPSDGILVGKAYEVVLLKVVEAVCCVAHLLPLDSQSREHGDCAAVLEVIGQGGASTVGAKAVDVDIRVLEVSRVDCKDCVLRSVLTYPEQRVEPGVGTGLLPGELNVRAAGIGLLGHIEHAGRKGQNESGKHPETVFGEELPYDTAKEHDEDQGDEMKAAQRLKAREHIEIVRGSEEGSYPDGEQSEGDESQAEAPELRRGAAEVSFPEPDEEGKRR